MTRLEELLRASGVDALLRGHPDAIYAFDLDGQFIDFNDTLSTMLGYTRQELEATNFAPLVDPAMLPLTMENFYRSVAGETVRYSTRGLRKSGEVIEIDITNLPLRDAKGEIVAVMGLARDVSEEARARERLYAITSVARMAARLARLGGWSVEVGDEHVEFSEELLDILGIELNGSPTLDGSLGQLPDEEGPRMARYIRRCMADGSSFDVFSQIRDGASNLLDVRMIGEAERDADGDIVRVVGVLYDVTTLLRQSENVERLERRMSETFNGIESALILVNRQWIVEFINDAGLNLLGLGRKAVLGASVFDIVPNFDQTQMYPTYVSAMNDGRFASQTVYLADRDQWLNMTVLPAPDGLLISGRDVTTEERVKANLKESATRADLLAQMVDRSKDAMVIQSFEHGITYWNKAAEDLYGWTHDEVAGGAHFDLLYDDPTSAGVAEESVNRDGFWMGEQQQKTKSGALITVECRWQLIRDDQGAPTGVFGVNRDVTAVNLERESRARNQRMESIGTLASGMAHDLNNVLTPILLTLGVLERDQADDAKRELIKSMETSVKRGAQMIQQVLSYARGVKGEREAVDLAELMRGVLLLSRESLPKNIELSVHLEPGLWVVSGDATQLMQVVLNLITNARDAMPNGGHLEIGARNGYGADAGRISTDFEGNRFVYVEVVDDGLGINDEVLARIFEPFYSTKPVGLGTGLGLSTSQAIAKSHDGRLEVTSTPGHGSRFALILPALADTASMSTSSGEGDPDKCDVVAVTGRRLLVVDDEPAILMMFEQILRAEHYLVDVAKDGLEALTLVEQASTPYDVIVTDLNMPRMSGEDLALLVTARGDATRFIFMSGLTVSPNVRSAEIVRRSTFLQKPFQSGALLDALNEIFQFSPVH